MGKSTEVSSKARRRRFTTAEKIRILREADACAGEKGAVTALLRREGLYSSHLTTWRAQRTAGQFGASARKRGPVPTPPDPRDQQLVDLERRALRAEARADRAERLVELQKKVSELLGVPLSDPASELRR
jgi:transposase